ncbi:hypothetical protein UAW_00722 [Enterococcus haemoperoxidus ATCC BAA-382]|uniref:WxL domain-containing protein n=1 Tax=Enterococcus haemoperoxidus ATCC BAA-382 TaxID=1158608 RepID=R2SWG4_9ENTE|nr:hypothetical protein [Enterococcus haemoperoxidus]EOH99570.1 hypothetical protein UAW_00722 [Enterococcus haemoperoxidus ATCC BAA-382]EOT62690.1 hypothetical protein I583_01691 [Enterococcus haemoperoxidus ATCC BAA-382]OJG55157.1 hypothetical protein RV06_GL002194 [Enterococcus haemoperoxidus]
MKKKKLIRVALVIVGLLLGGVTTTVNAEKQTKRIYESDYAYVPSPALRNAFAGATIHHLEEMGEENRANDAQELLDNYGLIKKSDMKYLDVVETEFFDEDTSLEGAQYVENAKGVYIEFGNISDFRPLSNLTKVEELEIGVGGSIPDLSDFSKLTKVKRINIQLYANKSVMGEKGSGITNNLALLDISALNNMPNLENVRIETRGKLQPIVLKKGMTSYQMIDPVTLSKQFEGAEIQYFAGSVEDGVLKWTDIENPNEEEGYEGEEFLEFSWEIKKGNFSYKGDAEIPIIWK